MRPCTYQPSVKVISSRGIIATIRPMSPATSNRRAVDHRDEPGAHVLRVAGARPEVPRAGEAVAAVDRDALAVGGELAAHGHPVGGPEHLGEAGVGQVGGDRGGRRQVGDADPAEGAVVAGHAIQVSIMSTNVGSDPPAAAGFMYLISPVSHIASTIGAVRVRAVSEASASARTTSAIASTRSAPVSPTSVMPRSWPTTVTGAAPGPAGHSALPRLAEVVDNMQSRPGLRPGRPQTRSPRAGPEEHEPMPENFPHPMPFGWFSVGRLDEGADGSGHHRSTRFSTQVVVWRDGGRHLASRVRPGKCAGAWAGISASAVK